MEIIAIPLAAVESPEYADLDKCAKLFLIDLYIVIGDAERFTIDLDKPEKYRQSKGVWLPRRISTLVRAGLLVVDGKQKVACTERRVFRFKYSTLGELEMA